MIEMQQIPKIEIVTRFKYLPQNAPGRAYIFEHCFDSAYDDSFPSALEHYDSSVKKNSEIFDSHRFNFVNAIMWGDETDKMIDFFGYKLLDGDWHSNPSVFNWVTRNGLVVPSRGDFVSEITCAKGLRILGAEEEYRLTTPDLETYLSNFPEISGLVQKLSI
jgi:hypothetical protein